MGLPLISVRHPTPGFNGTDDGLASCMNVDVLDGDDRMISHSGSVKSVS
jgi:hypothetical protein